MTFTFLPRYPGGEDRPPSQRERHQQRLWSDEQVEVTIKAILILFGLDVVLGGLWACVGLPHPMAAAYLF